jgi:hypothetical protein
LQIGDLAAASVSAFQGKSQLSVASAILEKEPGPRITSLECIDYSGTLSGKNLPAFLFARLGVSFGR